MPVFHSSSLGSFDPYGVKKIKRHIHGKETRIMPLTVRGAYRWVRYPLYFFCLLMIRACPDMREQSAGGIPVTALGQYIVS